MLHLAQHLQDKSHIIWDWNGTILDDVDICISIISEILLDHGLNPITEAEYRKTFHFPVHSYYRALGLDPEKVSYTRVTKRFIDSYEAKLTHATLYRGVRELLMLLNSLGKSQSVLSAAKELDLIRLLKAHDLDQFFAKVSGLNNHDADSKVERGRQHLSDLNIPLENVILIGDTDHDLEVANALGIDVLLVDHGHQCGERLRKIHHRVYQRQRESCLA